MFVGTTLFLLATASPGPRGAIVGVPEHSAVAQAAVLAESLLGTAAPGTTRVRKATVAVCSMAGAGDKSASVSQNDPVIPLTGEDWENVYEPAEDTYLFMDALLKEMPELQDTRPAVVMEIGCGSGCITAYLAKNLPGITESSQTANTETLGPHLADPFCVVKL